MCLGDASSPEGRVTSWALSRRRPPRNVHLEAPASLLCTHHEANLATARGSHSLGNGKVYGINSPSIDAFIGQLSGALRQHIRVYSLVKLSSDSLQSDRDAVACRQTYRGERACPGSYLGYVGMVVYAYCTVPPTKTSWHIAARDLMISR